MPASKTRADITGYTLPSCPHCARANVLPRQRELRFSEIDGSSIPEFRRQLAARTGGSTVPQVVIDGEVTGGADRLAALDRLGFLAAIAAGEQFPIACEVSRVTPRSVSRWDYQPVDGSPRRAGERSKADEDRPSRRLIDSDHRVTRQGSPGGMLMVKTCVVLLADTDTHEAMGRMANALTSAKRPDR